MQVSIVQQPALRAAAVGHTGPYHLIGQAFGRLQPVLERAGLGGAGHHLIAVFHDDPTEIPAEALRSDAGVALMNGELAPQGSNEIIVEGGRFLSTRHLGSYRSLPHSWAAVVAELGQHGLRRGAGPGYEIYRNTPMNTAEPDLITDIFVPVA